MMNEINGLTRKPNPLMEDDETEEQEGVFKEVADRLQSQIDVLTKALDDEKKKTETKETSSKALCDASIAMVQKAQEMFQHKDFRCAFAIAETQGFKYAGPLLQEPAKDLVAAIQEFQKAWKTD